MAKMATMTKETWDALVPIIEGIDGGCNACITDFVKGLTGIFKLSDEMIAQIKVYGEPLKLE